MKDNNNNNKIYQIFNLGKSEAFEPPQRSRKLTRDHPSASESNRKHHKPSQREKRSNPIEEDTRPKAKARTQKQLRLYYHTKEDFIEFMNELKTVEVTEKMKKDASKIFVDSIRKYNFTNAEIKTLGFLNIKVIEANKDNAEAVSVLHVSEQRDYEIRF
jgi:hypothetical protein